MSKMCLGRGETSCPADPSVLDRMSCLETCATRALCELRRSYQPRLRRGCSVSGLYIAGTAGVVGWSGTAVPGAWRLTHKHSDAHRPNVPKRPLALSECEIERDCDALYLARMSSV